MAHATVKLGVRHTRNQMDNGFYWVVRNDRDGWEVGELYDGNFMFIGDGKQYPHEMFSNISNRIQAPEVPVTEPLVLVDYVGNGRSYPRGLTRMEGEKMFNKKR